MTALQGGQIQAEFRSISPGERSQLVNALKDKITVQEAPWVCKVDLLFNTEAKPFDNLKIRQALSMAIDRWGGSDALSKITILKPVGGPLLPGSPLALSNDELAALPGFGRDPEKSRAQAKAPAGRSWRVQPQVQAHQPQRQSPLHAARRLRDRPVAAHRRDGRASAARRVAAEGDASPTASSRSRSMPSAPTATIPSRLLLPYLSKSRSPRNMTRNESPQFDAVYDRFKSATNPTQRTVLATELQRMVISSANSVPVLWYSRLVAHVSSMKGWKIVPTHFANQDLADVWLDQ